jgi:hypothetical protein
MMVLAMQTTATRMAIHERVCERYDEVDANGKRACNHPYSRRYKIDGVYRYLCPDCAVRAKHNNPRCVCKSCRPDLDLSHLPACCQARLREKARWEGMSLTAVMLQWPDLRCENHSSVSNLPERSECGYCRFDRPLKKDGTFRKHDVVVGWTPCVPRKRHDPGSGERRVDESARRWAWLTNRTTALSSRSDPRIT